MQRHSKRYWRWTGRSDFAKNTAQNWPFAGAGTRTPTYTHAGAAFPVSGTSSLFHSLTRGCFAGSAHLGPLRHVHMPSETEWMGKRRHPVFIARSTTLRELSAMLASVRREPSSPPKPSGTHRGPVVVHHQVSLAEQFTRPGEVGRAQILSSRPARRQF